jgi:accessory colonization factor AcfC
MIASKKFLVILGLVMISAAAEAVFAQQIESVPGPKTLNVYGPGGPQAPMQECADLFSRMRGVTVKVTAGPEAKWISQAQADADIIFGGAEYMLTQFTLKYPNLVDPKDRKQLYTRAAGILVRKGNPKRIRSLKDLTRPGVNIIDVNGAGQLGLWEDLAGAKGLIPGIAKNTALSVESSAEAIEKWKQMPELDAWISYESWHLRLKDTTDLVKFPQSEKIYRGTPVTVSKITKSRKLAEEFIEFLQSERAHAVFRKWGWR